MGTNGAGMACSHFAAPDRCWRRICAPLAVTAASREPCVDDDERSSDSVTTMSGLMVESPYDAQLFREVDSAGQPGDFDDATQLDLSPQRPAGPW